MYLFHLGFVRPVMLWVVGVRYRRRGLLPAGPCLVVSNHNSHLDAAILMGLFPLRRLPRVHPVAAADYFGKNLFMQALAMWMMNGIPIERRPRPGVDPLQPVVDKLNAGHSLVFFPEGSRGEAGVVARFRPGIGKLARLIPGLQVVPVYLAGPERIWPRGSTVPVPLNVDAIVGKPRSYDPAHDPRAIAEQVQRDVLSLAPPKPPPPGAVARPPKRVAVCGLRAKAREATLRTITERLRRHGKTLGLGSNLIEADLQGLSEKPAPIAHGPHRLWTALLARLVGAGRGFSWPRFHERMEIARISETVGGQRAARFVVTDGSALVDFSTWAAADFYRGMLDDGELNRVVQYLSCERRIPFGKWWSFLRRAPEVWLVNEWALVHPPIPDVLVLLLGPAESAMRDIQAQRSTTEPDHNLESLERLNQGYRRIGELLRRRYHTVVIESDPDRGVASEIAEAVEAELLRLVDTERATGTDA